MVLHVLRALFILLMAAVGVLFIEEMAPIYPDRLAGDGDRGVVAVFLVCIDILAPRQKLAIFSGTFFGLVVGLSIAYALSFVMPLIVDQFQSLSSTLPAAALRRAHPIQSTCCIGVATCYLSISFILQTKDDFRFIIPYVEFSKQTKGRGRSCSTPAC